MKPRRLYGLLAAALALGRAAEAALTEEQFEVGWPLELPTEQRFFDIPLTLDVYRHAASLEQLAVLDATGEPMPFHRVSPPAPSASERRVTLAASPLYAEQSADAVAELNVATDDRRTNVTVTRPAEGTATEVVAFVVDARAVEAAPLAIELEWRPLPQPFLIDVVVEQSRTLTDWRQVGRASVAALAVDGTEILHGRIPVAASAGGYYRITWNRTVASDWLLRNATLVSSETRPTAPLVTRVAALDPSPELESADGAVEHALFFDLGGPLPVSAARLDFAGDNGWTRAELASSASLEGPWTRAAGHALFYELDYAGERLASEPLVLGRREARYWRLAPDAELPPQRVELELEYPQEFLRFAAVGAPPYLLAAGTRAAEAGPDPTFAAVWGELARDGAPPAAVLGARRELGGAAALATPFEFPWRTALLWAVLGGGAFAVAWMAVRLAREAFEKPS